MDPIINVRGKNIILNIWRVTKNYSFITCFKYKNHSLKLLIGK